MTESYVELKRRHQKMVNEFPMAFAFSNKQFEQGMKKLGLTKDDTDKVYSIPGGGFIRKTDSEAYGQMFELIRKEEKEAIDSDKDGSGYIAEMFEYELNNHEYGYVYDSEPALDALGLTFEEVEECERLSNGFKIAKEKIHKWNEERDC